MYRYGNSGNFWGVGIGIIIMAIVIILICRELICWYWKINRIVELMEDQNENLKKLLSHFGASLGVSEGFSNSRSLITHKKCPFCAEGIKDEAKICPHCGKNIQEYEEEQRVKVEEEKRNKEQEMRGKFKNIEDLFNDENIMEEAKKLRRIYGKSMYISHLNNKAKELGLGEIELNEDDIE